ncbi:hypothetical protein [Anoxybacteroides amylolyticum]|uniref:Uncharacterized protein n=1 Tax=Anoxybacteroides amylolyticum TaxID=294699 RepID=A0A161HTZ5_9BACL|nr:hypothetical protein [Anoxybacillus amylolyticus]ANB59588.1 hypothetical protein GFC30_860 [Anoxybacillus amylolyticus]
MSMIIQKDIEIMVQHIIRELIKEFGKSETEAKELIQKSDVVRSLAKDPMGFHESPYHWALSILTDADDIEALERHLGF